MTVIRDVLLTAAQSVRFNYETGCVFVPFLKLLSELFLKSCFMIGSPEFLHLFSYIDLLWGESLSFPTGCVYLFVALDCHVITAVAQLKWNVFRWLSGKPLRSLFTLGSQVGWNIPELLSSCYYYRALSLPRSARVTFPRPWKILPPDSQIFEMTFKMYWELHPISISSWNLISPQISIYRLLPISTLHCPWSFYSSSSKWFL